MLMLAVIMLVSCGKTKKEEPEELVAKPEIQNVKGPLGGCYEVVMKDYKIKSDFIGGIISVELKRTDKELPFNVKDATAVGVFDGSPIHVGLGIELLDENGDVVEIKNASEGGTGGAYSHDDILGILQLASGETGIVRWSVNMSNKPTSFRITSAVIEDKSDEGSDESDDTMTDDISEENVESQSTASSASNKWDDLLDSYDNYVEEYISFIYKAKDGDAGAVAKYTSLLKKAQALSNDLSEAEGEMTSYQWARYMEITKKMAIAEAGGL